MRLNIVNITGVLLTGWRTATESVATGMSTPVGQGPFDPESLPGRTPLGTFLSPNISPWFAPVSGPPSAFARAVAIAEGFAHPSVRVGTEAYCDLEKLLPTLGLRGGCRLAGHVLAAYSNHTHPETRCWSLRFLALFTKCTPGLTPQDLNALAATALDGLKDDQPRVRKLAITVLGSLLEKIGREDRLALVTRMTEWLEDPEAEIRRRAIDVVSGAFDSLDPQDWAEPFRRMAGRLTDEDPRVVYWAASAMMTIFRTPAGAELGNDEFRAERKICEDFLKAREEERQRYWRERAEARPKYHYPPEEPQAARGSGPVKTPSLEDALRTLNLSYEDVQSYDDVRRAYRRRAAALHPDKNPGVDGNRRFGDLMRAYLLICAAFGFEAGFK
ncbi:MAG TPA: HEAT repeat domain-containing protein [bacterium]|nr:HEAT repeat domain-containing protein [bacterium]